MFAYRGITLDLPFKLLQDIRLGRQICRAEITVSHLFSPVKHKSLILRAFYSCFRFVYFSVIEPILNAL